ncbi:MAG: SDR family oxidoreductase [Cyanobacteria bacterium RUI128]|nr:SDR family oxidoreductase [Cyanobacteria bacterium RUI128]
METILITGGTGLIGSSQVKHFLNEYKIALVYRNEEKLKVFGNHPNLIPIKIEDLLEENAPDKIISELDKNGIYPEYLINMANDLRWHKMEENGFAPRVCMQNLYTINVIFPYELTFKLAEHPKSKLKKVVNISSMYGIVPYNPYLYENPAVQTTPQYSLSKAALIHLTKELSIRYKDRGIMVNTISYGGVEGRVNDVFKRKFAEITPLKRMMKPEDTIPSVEFLLKDTSNYMTGQNIIVDGGRTVW